MEGRSGGSKEGRKNENKIVPIHRVLVKIKWKNIHKVLCAVLGLQYLAYISVQ